MRRNALLVSMLLLPMLLFSQQKVWIVFKDKDTAKFTPSESFTEEAISKIKNRNRDFDYYDIPVNDDYINQLVQSGIKISQQSNWLNAVAVKATKKQLAWANEQDFIKETRFITSQKVMSEFTDIDTTIKDNQLQLLNQQLEVFEPDFFYENNIDGKGVTIAFFDAGFPTVNESPFFKHLFENGQIKATYDFVTNKEFVYHAGSHGTSTLSCSAGMVGDKKIGLATGATYLLARTEMTVREPFSEEENWLAAVEWAYSHGADIISSSLGYTYQRYFTYEMDGHTSFVAEAARIATRKGMLVINANGNEGDADWKYIGTPADVDSVMSIGGISPDNLLRINFSSFGPNSQQQLKPNVTAFGKVVAAGNKGLKVTYGTSFSAPLITGFTACVWQLYPEKSNMEIMALVQEAAHLYPYYDYAHGYGIPKASFFKNDSTASKGKEAELYTTNKEVYARIIDFDTNTVSTNYIYCHVENKKGYLNWYKVMMVNNKEIFIAFTDDLAPNDTLRIKYKNTLLTFKKNTNE